MSWILIIAFLSSFLLIVMLYFFTKKKHSVDYQSLISLLDERIFPAGMEQKREGARKIRTILKNKISLQEAEEMYVRKIALFYFEKYDCNNEPLIVYLRMYQNNKINFYESIELHDFFIKEHQTCESILWHEAFARFEIKTDFLGKSKEFIFTEINSEFARLFELEQADIRGKSIKLVSPELNNLLSDHFHDLMKKNLSKKIEHFDNRIKKQISIVTYSPAKARLITFIKETEKEQSSASARIA